MTDDELIEAHFVDLCRVLDVLRKHQVTCNGAKALLFATHVEFVEQVMGHGIRRTILGKLASLAHCEHPKNISEMRAFLGFCNCYSAYIHMYAEHAAPLTKLLHVGCEKGKKGSKKALAWTPESEKAFDYVKPTLLKPLSLHLLDRDKRFVLRTDTSDYAVGAVLEHVQEDGSRVPVAFWRRVLAAGQRRTWTPREKEAYTIVCALRKLAGHIGLQPVTVCTDHQSPQSWHKEHVDMPSGPAARRARCHETLAKFDLTVVYVPGRLNTVADCLSRWAYPASKVLADISMHGDEAKTAEAKRIMELDERLERGNTHCFVVMAQPAEGTKSERAAALPRRESSVAYERQAAREAWLRNTK